MQKDKTIEIWMPKLEAGYKHQAGIQTDVSSFVLGDKPGGKAFDYSLLDPDPPCSRQRSKTHNPNPGKQSSPYTAHVAPPTSFYVCLSLPRPEWIIGLDPVSCKIQDAAGTERESHLRPVGFRLLYKKTGTPVLTSTQDPQCPWPLPFDPAPGEREMQISIGYSPYNFDDYGHPEACDDFKRLGAMLGLTLGVAFDQPFQLKARERIVITNGPVNDCKAPVITMT